MIVVIVIPFSKTLVSTTSIIGDIPSPWACLIIILATATTRGSHLWTAGAVETIVIWVGLPHIVIDRMHESAIWLIALPWGCDMRRVKGMMVEKILWGRYP